MTDIERTETRPRLVSWPTFAVAALVSILTSPVTAIWLLLVAPVVVLVGLWRLRSDPGPRPEPVVSIGLGLLVGPVLYVGTAVVIAAT